MRNSIELSTLLVFLYLQLMDGLTTLIGLSLGANEGSPFVLLLLERGPVSGLLLSKVVALGLALLCFRLKKSYLIRWANVWYAGLTAWNAAIILHVLTREV